MLTGTASPPSRLPDPSAILICLEEVEASLAGELVLSGDAVLTGDAGFEGAVLSADVVIEPKF